MTRITLFIAVLMLSSCVGKKKFIAVEDDLVSTKTEVMNLNNQLSDLSSAHDQCKADNVRLANQISQMNSESTSDDQQIANLRDQVADLKRQREQQLDQIGNLTVLSKSANENIKATLSQMKNKDQYINRLSAAKSKSDSMNLALAVNLTSVLKDNINDQDIDIMVDKTVVYINLSDKMLYTSGSSTLTSRAKEVLGKIAKIVKSRPDVEVMVEGHTDNVPISSAGVKDNWDLSVKRATSVVRVLNQTYGIAPEKLIAAGRGEYKPLTGNDTREGRSTNRRTRIIIMPKLDQFYELLDPTKAGSPE